MNNPLFWSKKPIIYTSADQLRLATDHLRSAIEHLHPLTDHSHPLTDHSHPTTDYLHLVTDYSHPATDHSHPAADYFDKCILGRWDHFKCNFYGGGPGAVVKSACLESRRLRVQTPFWHSHFKEAQCLLPSHS